VGTPKAKKYMLTMAKAEGAEQQRVLFGYGVVLP
jgi:hypothetical protein